MVGEIVNHKMLCLGNLGELFGEMEKLMGGWGKIGGRLTKVWQKLEQIDGSKVSLKA